MENIMKIKLNKKIIEYARKLCKNNNDINYHRAICEMVSLLIYGSADNSFYIASKLGVYPIN